MAQTVSFVAETDAQQVLTGSTFTVTYTLHNADGAQFKPPDFTPFERLSGPATSHRTTIVNGSVSKSVSYSYMLRATMEGHCEIPGASILVDTRKVLLSNKLNIQVLAGRAEAETGTGTRVFIKAIVDVEEAFTGQQVILRYKLYTDTNVQHYQVMGESDYEGCFPQMMDPFREPTLRGVVDGREYVSKVIRKVHLYPQQMGTLHIDPLTVQVAVGGTGSVFGRLFQNERLTIHSNAVELQIRSPYEGAPDGYSGAVGHFQASFKLSPTTVTTDDAVSLRVQVYGTGDVKTIRAPKIHLPDQFRLFQPRVADQRTISRNDTIWAEKTFEYLFASDQPGQFVLTPSFIYLDPRTQEFVTVADSLLLLVEPGIQRHRPTDGRLERLEEIAQPMLVGSDLSRVRPPLALRNWYPVAHTLPILALLLLSSIRKTSADGNAIKQDKLESAVAQLRQIIDANNQDLHTDLEPISIATRDCLATLLGLEHADLDKKHVDAALRQRSLDDNLRQSIIELLDQYDLALYAGIVTAYATNKLSERSLTLMQQLLTALR